MPESVCLQARNRVMYMQQTRNIARSLGVDTNGLSMIEVVRAIQRAEGNFDCFATDTSGGCDQDQCRWRADCCRLARLRRLGIGH